MAFFIKWRALRALKIGVVSVLDEMASLTCLISLKLMKCLIELMYLMEGRKLLDAYVFNELQKIAKPIVTYTVFPWNFYIFVSFLFFIHTWN